MSTVPGVDLRDPGLAARLHVAFDGAPPVAAVRPGVWFLSRHAEVAAVLKDRERCGTDIHAVRGYDAERPFGAGSALERFQEGLLINLGAEDHKRIRGAFTAPFTRSRVEAAMTALVRAVAEELVGALGDSCDLVEALARPLPARVFAALFAIPGADVDWLLARLHEDTVALDVLLDPGLLSPEALAGGERAMGELLAYLRELADARRRAPGDDLMSWLVASDALSDDDVVTQAFEALAAGTNTTITLIAGMVEAFAAFPSEWDRVRAFRGLIPGAVEEALRYVSPVLSMNRVALEDFSVAGEDILAGDVLQCGVLPANRDPSVFASPHVFDVGRSPNPHVAFGGGVHTCLGAHVARLEARVVLEGLLDRFRRVEAGPAELHPTLMVRTYRSLPVALRA